MAELTWAQRQALIRAQALEQRIPQMETQLATVEPRLPPAMSPEQEQVAVALREGAASGLDALNALSALTDDAQTVEDVRVILDGVIRELIRLHRLATGELDTPGTGAEPETPTVPDDVPEWSQPTGAHNAYKPGALVRWDGKVWRNRTTAWLAHSPADYPAGWELVLDPGVTDPGAGGDGGTGDGYPAWSADATYAVGDRVTHNGHAWECKVAHGAEYQGTWAPGIAPTVWTDLGPV